MFVHLITVFVLLYFFMLYNLIVFYTSPWYFVLYISCEWVVLPLHHCYICVCMNIFVNVIYMVTAICWCTSYDILVGFSISWGFCHAYFLCINFYSVVAILVYLNLQKCININFFNQLSHVLKQIYLFLVSQYLIY